jgi:hypothetical protein
MAREEVLDELHLSQLWLSCENRLLLKYDFQFIIFKWKFPCKLVSINVSSGNETLTVEIKLVECLDKKKY